MLGRWCRMVCIIWVRVLWLTWADGRACGAKLTIIMSCAMDSAVGEEYAKWVSRENYWLLIRCTAFS